MVRGLRPVAEDIARLTGRDLRKVRRALGSLLSRRQIQYDPAAGQYIFFVFDARAVE